MKSSIKGYLLVFASSLMWSFSGVLAKQVSWGGISINGVRSIIAVLIYGIYRGSFKVKLSQSTVIGAIGVAATSLLYMCALKYTTSANAIVLQYSMPVYVVLINWIAFKSKPGMKEIFTVPIVLLGVVLCCVSEMGGSMKGNMLALLSGITYAGVFIASDMKGADTVNYTYAGNLLSSVLLIGVLVDPAVRFGFELPVLKEWAFVLLMGVSLGFGYLLLALGMKSGLPGISAAILSNLEPVLNPIWVALFVGEVPNALGLVGCTLVLVTVTVYSCISGRKAG